MLQGHGDDSYRFAREIVADFSTNVWYGAEPARMKEYLFDNWQAINKYPEVVAESLCEKIAAHYNLSSDNILVNNGSTESIYLIAQAFQNQSSTILIPSFSEYEDACSLYNHTITYHHWEALKADLRFDTGLCFICNPNNPTGSIFKELEELIRFNSQTVFVIDEAFIDFTDAVGSLIAKVNDYQNLIVLHSLTKTYAIPGLRLGFVAASKAIINRIKSYKFPWSVNTMALNAGRFIFEHFSDVQLPLKELLNDKHLFSRELQSAGFRVIDSNTHFFLIQTGGGTAASLKQYLIEKFGILVRDASNFRGLEQQYIRVATLQPEKNRLLVEALKQWRAQH